MPSRSQYEQYVTMPTVKAALDTIAWAEGGKYNNMFGGRTFSGNQHPNICVPYRSTCSTAAGRYQFLYSTWRGLASNLGLPDFSPHNQDIGAVYLIWQRGQLDNLLNGNFEAMMRGLGCLWAALPYATCGQTRRPLAATLDYYNSALRVYQGRSGNAPINTNANVNTNTNTNASTNTNANASTNAVVQDNGDDTIIFAGLAIALLLLL